MTEIPLTEIPCPLCGSEKSVPVTRAIDYVYGVTGEYQFVKCQPCQHIYINPRPTDDALMACYPSEYAPHTSECNAGPTDENSASETRSGLRRLIGRLPLLKRFLFWLGQQHGTVIPPLPSHDGPRLLEIGCAHGGFLAEASQAGWNVDGIEPDEAAADRARQRGFDVQTSTFTAASMSDQSRDAIVAWMVLEHVPDPAAFVREAFRVLKPSGSFCVSVPNGGGFERRMFGRHWLGYDAPRHLQVFSSRRLKTLLQQAGFVDVRIIHQSSIRYWWGSIAAWGMDHRPNAAWPKRWMDYFINDPPRWMKIASLIPEKTLALMHFSGRITVTAKKPN